MNNNKRSNLNLTYQRVVPKFLRGQMEDTEARDSRQKEELAAKSVALQKLDDNDPLLEEDMPVVVAMTEEVRPGKKVKVDLSRSDVNDELSNKGFRTSTNSTQNTQSTDPSSSKAIEFAPKKPAKTGEPVAPTKPEDRKKSKKLLSFDADSM
eukprot:c3932_g1_i2.p1 GENE.c3932_g1_i2~~c3932_g1_i2.p1  ORF type:complete len:152 (+),score=25.80 c3932_g1_i2:38-493(+)